MRAESTPLFREGSSLMAPSSNSEEIANSPTSRGILNTIFRFYYVSMTAVLCYMFYLFSYTANRSRSQEVSQLFRLAKQVVRWKRDAQSMGQDMVWYSICCYSGGRRRDGLYCVQNGLNCSTSVINHVAHSPVSPIMLSELNFWIVMHV